MRQITKDEVTVSVRCEQDHIPVRGNAMASGDDEVDREVEDEILARLENGDEWAWGAVTVRVTWTAPSGREYYGDDHLGGCSYADEKDFREGPYFDDMVDEALSRLNAELGDLAEDLAAL